MAVIGAAVSFFIGGIGGVFGLWGVVCGIIMIVGGTMMNGHPDQHNMWGTIVLVFPILSLAGGGLIIGFILGLIGGALSIAWRPQMVEPPQRFTPTQTTNLRICTNCGNAVETNARFCPSCCKELHA
ncbi:MAG: DUF6114 domain-containing protein [Nitrososphaeria archaeon]|jgi:hypothetical protein